MAHPKPKVLVTGVTGFLGSHIALQLVQKGYQVRGTVRDLSNQKKLAFLARFPSPIELVQADLLKPETLKAAIAGCDYVIHSASPFPADSPADEQVLIKPAVEGTMGVLKAAAEEKMVKHVVITSSVVANLSFTGAMKEKYTEEDWAEVEGNIPYNKSKILAEKAAWDFYHVAPRSFKMTVINPGFMLGPALSATEFTSGDRIKKILTGEYTFLGKISFSVVDVRDVAAAHIAALENPTVSGGKRYICYSGETLWFEEIAKILRDEYQSKGYTKIPTFVVNDCPIKDPKNPVAICWGKQMKLDNSKIISELGSKFRPAKESVLEMAQSLIELGLVPDYSKTISK